MSTSEELDETIECDAHGLGFQTYVCAHLAADPRQKWHFQMPTDQERWPDAWCSGCHEAFQREGEWNERNESELRIKLFCHHCYESHRALGTFIEV